MPQNLFVGLMSGTSTDGVDAVLADFGGDGRPAILDSCSLAMPAALRDELLALNSPGPDELARAARAANALVRLYARATHEVLKRAGVAAAQVRAIGAHGQTVRHDPAAGYTIQLNSPALLVELTGIPVIADFRSRDIAAGGQGAPLVPAFHHAVFACGHPRAVLNLGGIANVTLLEPDGEIRGFDTGPANVLLDMWIQSSTGRPYDDEGKWAASGRCDARLLEHLLESEPWFKLAPPKSTGRDLFNWPWLSGRLNTFYDRAARLRDNDVQATLQRLTARSAARAIMEHAPKTQEVLVCGGGALNTGLLNDLRAELGRPVDPTSVHGIPVQLVEALAFAWLAWMHEEGRPACLPAVTGARTATIAGCRYP
ncbi:anhydro-N-acetylmuramic acid kinase [Parapusillimonas granuli]|uniref:Anhydro-N-acetylmuramic acid kinase n=1 Tax=Parapusillimonas granuli TaxID=380911 RepID=A0A853G880_9BURK|nr:anhydro-N-acetylmuramic acid kinase [Parapusillimonas granuli]MBB5215860.1 anhydro-N-acetylmuramic acid kinase [Parapusillimonas granuli]MEB2399449.1 anhydro-N-acetylmuramic acid kinase [Alcaligenaceae bacterium]NYT50841.1 anhydro-N-acetylmuramic acid kinase [Parapusillimonas granuli]